jgi:putative transposase
MGFLKAALMFFRTWFVSKSNLAVENLALRQQLAIMSQSIKRSKLRHCDRVFWTWLRRLWPYWRSALMIVQPETVIRWHRQGF